MTDEREELKQAAKATLIRLPLSDDSIEILERRYAELTPVQHDAVVRAVSDAAATKGSRVAFAKSAIEILKVAVAVGLV